MSGSSNPTFASFKFPFDERNADLCLVEVFPSLALMETRTVPPRPVRSMLVQLLTITKLLHMLSCTHGTCRRMSHHSILAMLTTGKESLCRFISISCHELSPLNSSFDGSSIVESGGRWLFSSQHTNSTFFTAGSLHPPPQPQTTSWRSVHPLTVVGIARLMGTPSRVPTHSSIMRAYGPSTIPADSLPP
jgi:hypothetical protein